MVTEDRERFSRAVEDAQDIAEVIKTMLLRSGGQKIANVEFKGIDWETRPLGSFPKIIINIGITGSPDRAGLQEAIDKLVKRRGLPSGFVIEFDITTGAQEAMEMRK